MKTEVLVIGGGVAGLSLAILLGKAGIQTVLVEPRKFTFDNSQDHYGRTAALMGGSINILKALDIWQEIEKQTAPLEIMRIIDDSNPNKEPVQIDFTATEAGQENFGRNIPNMMLHKLLAEKAAETDNITLLTSTKLEQFKTTGSKVLATLDNGKQIEASLLVGADGKKSIVRKQSNIDTRIHDYNQSAITCLIEHSKPHNNTSTEHHRAGGPFTTVPMPNKEEKHVSSVVWVETTEDSEGFIKLDKNAFEKALQTRTRNALGEVKLASNPENWPLKAIIAKDIIAPRVALIAEAAHVMSPIGAQGLNLSLRDVATLAEVIMDTMRLGEDIGSHTALNQYKKRRQLDITTRFTGVDGYNRIVSNNLGFLRGLRQAGLKTLDAVPAFKNLAMQHGLKPVNDDSRLMKGEAL